MKSFSNLDSKPIIKVSLPNIKSKDMFKFQTPFNSLQSAKANYSRPNLPNYKNSRNSPSSNSSNSKDTQPNSEKSLSNEDSLSDIPKLNYPPSLPSLRNHT